MAGFSPDDRILLQVSRAADDVRRGVPVIVTAPDGHLLVLPLELADGSALSLFDDLAAAVALGGNSHGDSFLILTDRRAEALAVAHKGRRAVRVARSRWLTGADMRTLADPLADLAHPFQGPFTRLEADPLKAEAPLADRAALKLIKVARLLPAALAVPVADAALAADGLLGDMMRVAAADVLEMDTLQARRLTRAASAHVPLQAAADVRLIAFRPITGGVEHIAILVGDPSPAMPVLTRLHSECFTGDLIGSLKCDCGDQLKGAIKAIKAAGGGVVLYLAQEGRGIGLLSKLKAYGLQDQGYDTVDANTRLGFDADERIFAPAALMLDNLGFSQVRLMTNNPEKVAGLERLGITVTERVPHAFPTNPHNQGYLDTKKRRSGHLL
ncbi:GTP cyclohydrolase II [Yunchengibacter salinarum]|uniref:GTP cyclohydrolase II n=1 Tax=Yunchengibacter salinarum TaxID=3133399 RepID=UPI0035B66551